MDSKEKILLGQYDILSKDNEDLFLNIEISRTFNEIRKDRHENVFDVFKQWKKERDSSRDFRIYGIVDSNYTNTDQTYLDIYSSLTDESPFDVIQCTSLGYGGYNVYGYKRGKYMLELNDYPHDFVYLKFPGDGTNSEDQYFAQQLIFRDADQNIIEFGTQAIEVDTNGNSVTINNDFYFFYNKHWVKKDLWISKK